VVGWKMAEDDKQFQVILNISAGPDAKTDVLRDVTELLDGDPSWQISVAHSGAEIRELAEKVAKGDCQVVVAGGGDGTISTVASVLVGTSKTLGVLPVGTLNHFAKDLNLPLDLASAINTIRDGRTIRVDVGEVNGRTFINNSGLGLYPSIVKQRTKHQRLGMGKWRAFFWASLQVLRRFRLLDVKLKTAVDEIECRTPFVFVGNNRYEMEGFRIGGRERLDAGELSLYITTRTGRASLFWLALRGLFGGLLKEKDFTAMTATDINIHSRHHRLRVATDGEVTIMQPPLQYKILPAALQVLVPEVED
jgi:YegS/Rv2252/BmrU family lipid kinase